MASIKVKVDPSGEAKIKGMVKAMSKLDLGKEFWNGVGAIAAGGIIDNIESGKTADGGFFTGSIKRNARSTRDKKKAQGNAPIRSLVDKERRFIRKGRTSWTWRVSKKGVTVRPNGRIKGILLRELVVWVQERGYVGWFGLNAKVRKAVGELLRRRIERILKKAGV